MQCFNRKYFLSNTLCLKVKMCLYVQCTNTTVFFLTFILIFSLFHNIICNLCKKKKKNMFFCIYKTVTKRRKKIELRTAKKRMWKKRWYFFVVLLLLNLKIAVTKANFQLWHILEKKALLFSLIGNRLIRDWNGLYQRLHTHERTSRLCRAESFAY